jgi:hypothetical protein
MRDELTQAFPDIPEARQLEGVAGSILQTLCSLQGLKQTK